MITKYGKRYGENETTDVVVRIDDFGGKVGLTIREHVTSDGYTGFTKSGTRISAENFADFKKLINSIDENDLKAEEIKEGKEEEEKTIEKKAEKTKISRRKTKGKAENKEEEKETEEAEEF